MAEQQRPSPTLAVLMAVYNGTNPTFFECALHSIVTQTHQPDQIVIVFDGPVDPELDDIITRIVPVYDHYKLTLLRYPQNMGLGYALCEGVMACVCDFIARMDDDDISVPNRLEQQINLLKKHQNVDVLGGQIIEFTSNKRLSMRIAPLQDEAIKRGMTTKNRVNHVTVCIRRTAVLNVGNYDHKIKAGFEDYELWRRMIAHHCQFLNSEEPLVLVRFDRSQLSRRVGIDYLFEEWKIHYQFWKAGYNSVGVFGVAMLTRLPIRILPTPVLAIIYGAILRSSLPDKHRKLCDELLKDTV